jgi:hypothetical protein
MRLNRPGEAVIVWEETAQQGHGHAAELLSQFFVAIGQGKKAALWLKLSREGVHQQPSIGGQVKKKRRKPRNKSRRKRKL